jgi:hypothetical protein
MNLTSQLRHFLTYLAGLGTAFAVWHLIAPEQAAEVNKAGSALIEPLMVIIGAVAVFLARAAMAWLGSLFSGKKDNGDNGGSGGGSSGGMVPLLLLAGAMAGLVGVLPSCSSSGWDVRYTDPMTDARIQVIGEGK